MGPVPKGTISEEHNLLPQLSEPAFPKPRMFATTKRTAPRTHPIHRRPPHHRTGNKDQEMEEQRHKTTPFMEDLDHTESTVRPRQLSPPISAPQAVTNRRLGGGNVLHRPVPTSTSIHYILIIIHSIFLVEILVYCTAFNQCILTTFQCPGALCIMLHHFLLEQPPPHLQQGAAALLPPQASDARPQQ